MSSLSRTRGQCNILKVLSDSPARAAFNFKVRVQQQLLVDFWFGWEIQQSGTFRAATSAYPITGRIRAKISTVVLNIADPRSNWSSLTVHLQRTWTSFMRNHEVVLLEQEMTKARAFRRT